MRYILVQTNKTRNTMVIHPTNIQKHMSVLKRQSCYYITLKLWDRATLAKPGSQAISSLARVSSVPEGWASELATRHLEYTSSNKRKCENEQLASEKNKLTEDNTVHDITGIEQ